MLSDWRQTILVLALLTSLIFLHAVAVMKGVSIGPKSVQDCLCFTEDL